MPIRIFEGLCWAAMLTVKLGEVAFNTDRAQVFALTTNCRILFTHAQLGVEDHGKKMITAASSVFTAACNGLLSPLCVRINLLQFDVV